VAVMVLVVVVIVVIVVPAEQRLDREHSGHLLPRCWRSPPAGRSG
jgi:hypothetical protein